MARNLFALLFTGFAVWALIGWWHSTRYWMAWVAETPIGVFTIISESSLFGVGAQVMHHEHSWTFYKNADEITGDSMIWLGSLPEIRNLCEETYLMVPYWQLIFATLFIALACFVIQKSLTLKKKKSLSSRGD